MAEPKFPNFYIHTEEKLFTVPDDRLVSGLVIVNVRNMSDDDIVNTYAKNWSLNSGSHTHGPNNISSTPGVAPFYRDDDFDHADNSKPPKFPTEETFDDGVYQAPDNTFRKISMSTSTPNVLTEVLGDVTNTYGRPISMAPHVNIVGRKYTKTNTSQESGRAQSTKIDFSDTNGYTDMTWFGDDDGSGGNKYGRYFILYGRSVKSGVTDGVITGAARDVYNNGKYLIWFKDTNGTNSTVPNHGLTGNDAPLVTTSVSYDSSTDTYGDVMENLRTALDGIDTAATGYDYGGEELFATVTIDGSNNVTAVDIENYPRMSRNTFDGNATGNVAEVGTCDSLKFTENVGTKNGWSYGTGSKFGGENASPTEVRNDKELGIGDYDSYLFYVTFAVHIDRTVSGIAGVSNGAIAYTTNGEDRLFHHNKCQSFVKSHLISRINNASDTNAFASAAYIALGHNNTSGNPPNNPYSGGSNYREGIKRMIETIASPGYTSQTPDAAGEVTTNPLTNTTDYLFNNGIYVHAPDLDGSPAASNIPFGIDLSATHSDTGSAIYPNGLNGSTISHGSNSFFTPVKNIEIFASHAAPDADYGYGHGANASLGIRVHMYQPSDTVGEYTQNRANILWMPWGETAKITDP